MVRGVLAQAQAPLLASGGSAEVDMKDRRHVCVLHQKLSRAGFATENFEIQGSGIWGSVSTIGVKGCL